MSIKYKRNEHIYSFEIIDSIQVSLPGYSTRRFCIWSFPFPKLVESYEILIQSYGAHKQIISIHYETPSRRSYLNQRRTCWHCHRTTEKWKDKYDILGFVYNESRTTNKCSRMWFVDRIDLFLFGVPFLAKWW